MASTARSSSSCPGSATVRPQAPSPGRPPSCPARRNAALSQHGSPACKAMPRDAELHCFPPRPTEGNKRHRGWSLLGGFQSEEALTLIDSQTHTTYTRGTGDDTQQCSYSALGTLPLDACSCLSWLSIRGDRATSAPPHSPDSKSDSRTLHSLAPKGPGFPEPPRALCSKFQGSVRGTGDSLQASAKLRTQTRRGWPRTEASTCPSLLSRYLPSRDRCQAHSLE